MGLCLYIYSCVITCLATVSNIQQPQELCTSLGTMSIQSGLYVKFKSNFFRWVLVTLVDWQL